MTHQLEQISDSLDRLYGKDDDTTRQIDFWHEHRRAGINDIRRPNFIIPELDAYDVYGEVAERERLLVAPDLHIDNYRAGTARHDDEVRVVRSGNEIVVSADHATDPVRKATGVLGRADHGTAGLGSLVAEKANGALVLPAGRQTSNANVALEHPLKDALAVNIRDTSAFLSLHGMAPGKIEHQFDPSEVHGVLGLGKDPDEDALDMASDVVRRMKDELGLRFVIGNATKLYPLADEAPRLQRDETGELVTVSLAAKGEGTTTSFVRRQNDTISAMQVELSRSIRFLPSGVEYREYEAARAGVHLGWLAVRQLCIMMRPQ